MPKFLIIQTAFIGDVVLATAIVEKLNQYFPAAQIDFLLRKGNEQLLQHHPILKNIWIWDKKKQKQKNLLGVARTIRREQYSHVINLHRFATSGFITLMSGAENRIGFDKNPLSAFYTKKVKHIISEPYSPNPIHETERNQSLIADITDDKPALPKLYPQPADYEKIKYLQSQSYICIAPSSVWFTKQFPENKWAALIDELPETYKVYLLGGPADCDIAENILKTSKHTNIINLSGQLSYLQSAALMQGAIMNYVNDSAPLHFASSVNAPVTAVYCSTVPAFGFGPLSDNSKIVEIDERLYCRPCGLHGHKACPEGHFRCALEISNSQLLWWNSKKI